MKIPHVRSSGGFNRYRNMALDIEMLYDGSPSLSAGDQMETVSLPTDGHTGCAGMRSVKFLSPDGNHVVEAPYESEPPHGDSFHLVYVDGVRFPGYLWGCNFAWNPDSGYFVGSWMAKWIDRRTVVIDVRSKRYFVLSEYFYDFVVNYPTISEVRTEGIPDSLAQRMFVFKGDEQWVGYGDRGPAVA